MKWNQKNNLWWYLTVPTTGVSNWAAVYPRTGRWVVYLDSQLTALGDAESPRQAQDAAVMYLNTHGFNLAVEYDS